MIIVNALVKATSVRFGLGTPPGVSLLILINTTADQERTLNTSAQGEQTLSKFAQRRIRALAAGWSGSFNPLEPQQAVSRKRLSGYPPGRCCWFRRKRALCLPSRLNGVAGLTLLKRSGDGGRKMLIIS